ncbi:MAG: putative nucleotidyltransferase [Caldanaerobacter subterraneus]|jgi:predicted nucleotidyltransferase|uniref:Predicted nucleotidyltransferases n=3 Tax=Caldanaerobacter subterraneus TaxID=911092 RepID=Q8R8N8_CALS4|nr:MULTISPECIES: nucleotidyltransferase domain-containing protein [Caldanaerobacter]AAM25136.1 predicted nucleotidyltransferases [Caldanaerobacter subterraneus subsp. tengcongensis MB4]KKC29212.1 nucleotidyltransferase [Caldanaerobacter subterraneus subsp. pacificus DSM 12653]KUK09418.1 MAG: putative nucleotidyltransferase [Caldanaerobacter subterraneus]MBE3578601.1 nucleotidyltransferase domain-containing protein [Caldanaerobacter subterraneus]MCS3915272.1 putative nucleotidyltransferase [Cal
MDTDVDRKMIQKLVKEYIDLVKKEINVKNAYLFGSYARGKYDENSDIDIAIVSDDFTGDMIEDTFRLMRLRRKIDMRIEPHPFRTVDFDVSNPYVKEIVTKGIKVV